MEKFVLAWDVVWTFTEPVQAFAVFNGFFLVSNSIGTVQVLGKYLIKLQPEPVDFIFHLKNNFFGIGQKSCFVVVEVEENRYLVVKSLRDRVLGCCEDLVWTRLNVLDENFKVVYSVNEQEEEIVQVCKVNGFIAVSSLTRTVIVGKDKIVQVGKKERNGPFGACGYLNSLYASRPLGNLWQANFEGVVMLTTSYKVNSEKVQFGSLFKMGHFLVSISQKHSNFIVIDPGKQLIVHYEKLEQGCQVFFNLITKTLYKRSPSGIHQAAILTISEYFQRLLLGDTNETVGFVLSNPELQSLDTLQPLCVQVFSDNREVAPSLLERFCSVVGALEENMSLPDVKVKEEVLENDELFDEFLRLSLLEKAGKVKGKVRRVGKRIRDYERKSFVWLILANWLMFVILKKNEKHFRIRTWLRIAERSLDYTKFSLLVQEERLAIQQIESIL